jgi:hypothetical protein
MNELRGTNPCAGVSGGMILGLRDRSPIRKGGVKSNGGRWPNASKNASDGDR